MTGTSRGKFYDEVGKRLWRETGQCGTNADSYFGGLRYTGWSSGSDVSVLVETYKMLLKDECPSHACDVII